jgi:hypothetical protein
MRPISDIASDINEYAEYSSKLYMTCSHLDIRLPASPTLNFRDALSHYISRYDATTHDEQLKQETSINEHLSRGFKDGCVFILYEMKDRVTKALENEKSKAEKVIFRKHMHEYKRMEIEVRRGNKLADIKKLFKFADKLINSIRNTESVFLDCHVPFKANANHQLPLI